MDRRLPLAIMLALALSTGLSGCSSTAGTASSLFSQLGGMDSVTKLGSSLLSNSMSDPRLSSLLGKVDPAVASPKVSNQLCSALGGGCTAPFTKDQISAAGDKLSNDQKSAISDNFSKSLAAVSSNPALRDAVTKSLGSQLGGIVGAVL